MCTNIFKNNRVRHWSIHHDALQDHTDFASMTHIHDGSCCQLRIPAVGLPLSVCLRLSAQRSSPVSIMVWFVAVQPGDSRLPSFRTLFDLRIASPVRSSAIPNPRLRHMEGYGALGRGSLKLVDGFEVGWLSCPCCILSFVSGYPWLVLKYRLYYCTSKYYLIGSTTTEVLC